MNAGLTIRVDRFGQVQFVPSHMFVYFPNGADPIEPDETGIYPVTEVPG